MNKKIFFVILFLLIVTGVLLAFFLLRKNIVKNVSVKSELPKIDLIYQQEGTGLNLVFEEINKVAESRLNPVLSKYHKDVKNVEVVMVDRDLPQLRTYGATTSGILQSAGDWEYNVGDSKLTLYIFNRQLNEDVSSISNLTNYNVTKQVIQLYMLALPMPPPLATTDTRDPESWSIERDFAALESKFFFNGGNTEDKSVGRYPIAVQLK